MPSPDLQFTCLRCGRRGTPDDVATGWSLSTPPRPTGSDAPREETVTALCPACARDAVRDLEGRLDP
ncbi:hypothetical protein OF117_04765 [Geodermatophilus sp. YIM 151500]|uniref:hypothetical protein n=1 Tax=Geodermatophilus sp. YIM 151500 TaxID=2984531 RepID=UPI0021E50FAF|nr:hypothetical protein [Geodermatophilus sp. YIM 151500]MCV2488667.1 hypothetical protein [Geodermatophilus sp. YIM 151500]